VTRTSLELESVSYLQISARDCGAAEMMNSRLSDLLKRLMRSWIIRILHTVSLPSTATALAKKQRPTLSYKSQSHDQYALFPPLEDSHRMMHHSLAVPVSPALHQ
jgi:hypothetical protein